MRRRWTARQVRSLGVRTDVATAGSVLGLSRTQAYEAVKAGRFPVPVVRVGRRMVVPTAALLRLLGLETEAAGPAPPGPAGTTVDPATAKERDHDQHSPAA